MQSMKTAAVAAFAALALPAQAANIMPDFANVPAGWTTDRYEPHSFSNVGAFQGRDNVLGIEIDDAEASPNRPLGQQGTFYNTQGRKNFITGGFGDSIGADLFIDSAWKDEANGTIRSDMWGTMENGAGAITAYGIIGFSNQGDDARYRVWDADVGGDGWVDLEIDVAFGAWTAFEMELAATSFLYSINGVVVYTDTTTGGSTGFREVIMQAYNFGDPSLSGVIPVNYTAHWSNSQVPEPGYVAMALLTIGGLGALRIRRRRSDG